MMALTADLTLLDGGRKLPLVEDFYTIQGEGYHSGKPAYFIRLGGCDVGCSWCDAKYTWNPKLYPPTEVETVVARAASCAAQAIVITNYPAGKSETFEVENNPTDPAAGTHEITFSRECWIEADDFMAEPIPKYKRLFPGGPECRLKGAYLIKCVGYETDENGNVTEIAAEYDPDSRGGDPADGRKVKGATLHWVDAATAIDAEVRVYSELFSDPAPDGADKDFLACMNPDSLETLTGCKVEARMRDVAAEYDKTEKQGKTAPSFQFMRLGYFCLDNKDCSADHLVFNRSVTLKDSFKV